MSYIRINDILDQTLENFADVLTSISFHLIPMQFQLRTNIQSYMASLLGVAQYGCDKLQATEKLYSDYDCTVATSCLMNLICTIDWNLQLTLVESYIKLRGEKI